MKPEETTLEAEYASALREYLEEGGETALSRAYTLGRDAAAAGGVLELARLHHEALASLGTDADGALRERLGKAAEFFAEVVSPLEMALSSYRDTTKSLLELNARLERQNEELARAKAAADAANTELEAFSYSVAHDLRAPLRAIDGFSQALIEDSEGKLDPEGVRHLRRVRAAGREMTQLIEGLLALSRVSRGELQRERVSLSALADASVARLRAADPGREVTVEVTPGLEVVGDGRLLGVVLDNLLGNAWKFTSKTADARIEVGRIDEPEPVYFVRDNGAGFDPAFAHKLFAVFQRLHSDAEFEGTGIGLATVQRIVRRHGGRIWAEGAVGRGATFFMVLPRP